MTAERQLFKKAILEALSQQYEQELAECKEDAKCSKAHYIRISENTGIPLTRLNLNETAPYKTINKSNQ